MSDATAFPGLVGCTISEPNPFEDGQRELGVVVGWEDGYLVLVAEDGTLTRVFASRQGLRVTERPGEVAP